MLATNVSELPRVTQWIHDWARRNDLPAATAERLDLCATELVTNIVSYAAGHQIVLALQRDGDVLRLEIADDGKPFDPLSVEPARATSLDDVRAGGLGIPIVRSFSDELRYERADGTNRLTVIQRLQPTPNG